MVHEAYESVFRFSHLHPCCRREGFRRHPVDLRRVSEEEILEVHWVVRCANTVGVWVLPFSARTTIGFVSQICHEVQRMAKQDDDESTEMLTLTSTLTGMGPSELPSPQKLFSSTKPNATSPKRAVLAERSGGAVVSTQERFIARIRYLGMSFSSRTPDSVDPKTTNVAKIRPLRISCRQVHQQQLLEHVQSFHMPHITTVEAIHYRHRGVPRRHRCVPHTDMAVVFTLLLLSLSVSLSRVPTLAVVNSLYYADLT